MTKKYDEREYTPSEEQDMDYSRNVSPDNDLSMSTTMQHKFTTNVLSNTTFSGRNYVKSLDREIALPNIS